MFSSWQFKDKKTLTVSSEGFSASDGIRKAFGNGVGEDVNAEPFWRPRTIARGCRDY